jgi:uncharacterized Ntn-hydrolase superfamily protein
MTYSLIAREPETGAFAVAVASRFFAVGAWIPNIRDSRSAVATQAFVSPLWGIEGADRIAAGEAPASVLADLKARDAGHAMRQWHGMGVDGVAVAHTGEGCVAWAGHAAAPNVSVAGNMLTGPEVVADTLAAFLDNGALPLAERMLAAMEAGERAGGDARGRQSAALRIHSGEAYPWIDIRADDHADPLAELRRLLGVAGERFLLFSRGVPTGADFSGALDRKPINDAIEQAEAARIAEGRPSLSHASDPDPTR